MRAFRTRDAFVPGTNARAWLFQILYSIFVNKYRSSQREPAVVSLEAPDELAAPAADGPEADVLRCTAPEVEAAFGALPEPYRAAVALVDLEELSVQKRPRPRCRVPWARCAHGCSGGAGCWRTRCGTTPFEPAT